MQFTCWQCCLWCIPFDKCPNLKISNWILSTSYTPSFACSDSSHIAAWVEAYFATYSMRQALQAHISVRGLWVNTAATQKKKSDVFLLFQDGKEPEADHLQAVQLWGDWRSKSYDFQLLFKIKFEGASTFSFLESMMCFYEFFLHVFTCVAVFCWLNVSVCCGKKNLREFFWDGSRPWTPSVSSWVNVVRMRWDAWDDWVVATHRFLEISPRSLGEDEPILTLYYFSDGWLTPPTRGMGSWGGGLYRWLWGSGVFFFCFFLLPFLVFLLPFFGVQKSLTLTGGRFFLFLDLDGMTGWPKWGSGISDF